MAKTRLREPICPPTATRAPPRHPSRPQDPDPLRRRRRHHELLDWLVGQRLSYSVGFILPDSITDELEHILRCSLVVGATIADAAREGYRANLPLREVEGAGPVAPLVAVDHQAVVVEAVKLAEDRGGDVVVRLYEAHGGRARARLRAAFPVAAVTETDLLNARSRPRAH